MEYLNFITKKWSSEFLTRSDTNLSVQCQNKARSLKFRILKEEGVNCMKRKQRDRSADHIYAIFFFS